jgi:hypothetical protein
MKRITIMLLVFIVTIFTCTNAFSQLKYQGGRVIIETNDPSVSYNCMGN